MKQFTAAVVTFFCAFSIFALEGWNENFKSAQEKAKKENKPVLALFTGSDWCPACKMLEKNVLSSEKFRSNAPKTYVLFYADFPQNKTQLPGTALQNKKLAEQYKITGFPTVVLISPDGTKKSEGISGLSRHETPDSYLERLNSARTAMEKQ